MSIIKQVQDQTRLRFDASKILFNISLDVEKHWSMKNRNQIFKAGGRTFIGKSSAIVSAKHWMTLKISQEKYRQNLTTIDGPVWVIFHFYCSNFWLKPKRKSDAQRMNMKMGDLSNLYQMPEDCLQAAGVIQDDSLICSHDLSRKLPSNSDKNWLEIFVIKFDHGM